MRQRVLTPSCKYLFCWMKDSWKIKRYWRSPLSVAGLYRYFLWNYLICLWSLFQRWLKDTLRRISSHECKKKKRKKKEKRKKKVKLLFLAIKTLLWRTKRKKGLFNWITLNSSLETYQNTIFYPSNCGDNKFWHPAVSIDFSWWKTNHGELFSLFLVSSSLIAFSDIEEQGKNWKCQRRHPGIYGVTIALRGDLNLIEDQEDSSTRKTISESIAATI